jgi:hypothetical protein
VWFVTLHFFFRVVSSGTSAPLVPLLRRFEQISSSKVGPLNASWDESAQIVVSLDFKFGSVTA